MCRLLLLIILFVVFNEVDENVTVTLPESELAAFLGTEQTPVDPTTTDYPDYLERVWHRWLAESRAGKNMTLKGDNAPEETLLQSILQHPWLIPGIGGLIIFIVVLAIYYICTKKRNPNAQQPVNQRPAVSPGSRDQGRPGFYRDRAPARAAGEEVELHEQARPLLDGQEQVEEPPEQNDGAQEPQNQNPRRGRAPQPQRRRSARIAQMRGEIEFDGDGELV